MLECQIDKLDSSWRRDCLELPADNLDSQTDYLNCYINIQTEKMLEKSFLKN